MGRDLAVIADDLPVGRHVQDVGVEESVVRAEITNVSLRRLDRSLATRFTESVIAFSSASMPCTCLTCQPHSVPSGRVAYHSTPPSGLPVRIARVPAGTWCLSSWYEISSKARLCSPFHVRVEVGGVYPCHAAFSLRGNVIPLQGESEASSRCLFKSISPSQARQFSVLPFYRIFGHVENPEIT
jgi:hypothetical protein